uniref:ilv operon leader peptide n=1 Tax=Candidatus Steffania adelgidicola str. Klausen-Leopoldsdorf TaxID=994478 RepID=G3ADS2_9GAMM|nr:IlvGMEDA operon leader peptide [Candidatus Steffania adelgidicola str. Klausen-Leopoldsdorf]
MKILIQVINLVLISVLVMIISLCGATLGQRKAC